MIKIRQGVFETNSSSSHSLVLLGNWRYKCALEAFDPALAKEFEEKLQNNYASTDEVKAAFENIGATIKDHVLDLSNVNPEEFDFGLVDTEAYNDPAHKLLLALTLADCDWYDAYSTDYFDDKLKDLLHELSIETVIPPKDGYTGVDHESIEELSTSVRYDLRDFVLRKDYVLVLSEG